MAGMVNCNSRIEEEYMSQGQLEFFKNKLLGWRQELIFVSNEIMQDLKEEKLRESDPVDCGSLQAEKERSIRTKTRNSQLIEQIEHALHRINRGVFGYCEMTGEEIGLERLMAMPLATLSIEAQEIIERRGVRQMSFARCTAVGTL